MSHSPTAMIGTHTAIPQSNRSLNGDLRNRRLTQPVPRWTSRAVMLASPDATKRLHYDE